MTFAIIPQTEGKGDNKKEVLIKRIKFRPGKPKKEGDPIPFFSVKFPLLKVVVGKPNMKGVFEVAWSNYGKQKGQNPGKFKLRHVVNSPVIIYLTDTNGRKVMHNRKPIIDIISMTQKYGTELDNMGNLVLKDNHPHERTVLWETEAETLFSAGQLLAQRFSQKLTGQILGLFLSHELFQAFLTTAARKAA